MERSGCRKENARILVTKWARLVTESLERHPGTSNMSEYLPKGVFVKILISDPTLDFEKRYKLLTIYSQYEHSFDTLWESTLQNEKHQDTSPLGSKVNINNFILLYYIIISF